MEGRCYVLSSNQYVTNWTLPEYTPGFAPRTTDEVVVSRGGSAIIDPMGNVVAGPLWDKEGILEVVINGFEKTLIRSKLDFDAVGHYARSDVFKLQVEGLDLGKG